MRANITLVEHHLRTIDPLTFDAERQLGHIVGPGTLMFVRRLCWIFDGVEAGVTLPVDLAAVATLIGVKSRSKVTSMVDRACRFRLMEHQVGDDYFLFNTWPQPSPGQHDLRQLIEAHVISSPVAPAAASASTPAE